MADADPREALRLELACWQRRTHTLWDMLPHPDKVLTVAQKKQATEWPSDGGGFGRPPQLGQVMTGPEQNRLKLTDDLLKTETAPFWRG